MLYYVGQIIYVSFDPAVHDHLFNRQADATVWVTYFGWLAAIMYTCSVYDSVFFFLSLRLRCAKSIFLVYRRTIGGGGGRSEYIMYI